MSLLRSDRGRFCWCSSLAILLSVAGSAQTRARAAEPLRYRWQPGGPFAYEIEVTADTPDSLETYRGRLVYTLAGSEGGVLKLTCSGGLTKSEKPKSGASSSPWDFGPFGPRGIGVPFGLRAPNPYPGLGQTTSTLTITPQGQVRTLEGNSQLPWLLGNLSLLILESFPEGDEPSWEEKGGVLITSKGREERSRFGPLHSPFGSSPEEKEKYATGATAASFKIVKSDGDLVVIEKESQMKLSDEGKLEIAGRGQWTFQRTLGVPEKLDFQQKINASRDNVTLSIPMTIKARRYSEEEWKQIQEQERRKREELARAAAEAKARADAQARIDAAIPLTADQKKALIADLKSGDFWRMKNALEKLAAKNVTDDDQELVAAIVPTAKHENPFIRRGAQAALKKWAPNLERKAKLNEAFLGPRDVQPTDKLVTESTPLPVGLILCARDFSGWHPVEVREVLPDGRVKVSFRGWGRREGTFARADLRLAPEEVDQPALAAAASPAAPAVPAAPAPAPVPAPVRTEYRLWTDASGKFQVEAEYVAVVDGKVQLRRKDGREISVPLARLSKADQEEVKKLQAANPFE